MSKDFLGYYFYSDEINLSLFPDLIITNGNLAKEILTKEAYLKTKFLLVQIYDIAKPLLLKNIIRKII